MIDLEAITWVHQLHRAALQSNAKKEMPLESFQLMPALKIAAKNEFKILDIQSEMKSEIYYQSDGIHFNAKGTEQLAQILKNKLFDNQ